MTSLLQFPNMNNDLLRGILVLPNTMECPHSVICIHGFERCATTEVKFKRLSEYFLEKNIPSFRLDFTGSGLSDGDFAKTTVHSMTEDLLKAIDVIKKETGVTKVSIVAHSLAGCVVANLSILKKFYEINKAVLLAPALNQRDLMRYWFVRNFVKKTYPALEITWKNYKEYLDENAFLEDSNRSRTTKSHRINADYFVDNRDKDYSHDLEPFQEHILYIHGTKDDTVPMESLNIDFSNKEIVEYGDHDIEKPELLGIWAKKAVQFINQ